MKNLNEIRLDETYTENRLKGFRIQDVQIENVEKKKLDLTLIQKNIKKFEKRAETVKEDLKKNFKMLKKKSDQIEELRKNL